MEALPELGLEVENQHHIRSEVKGKNERHRVGVDSASRQRPRRRERTQQTISLVSWHYKCEDAAVAAKYA
jgi:hypothetical protein